MKDECPSWRSEGKSSESSSSRRRRKVWGLRDELLGAWLGVVSGGYDVVRGPG